MRTMHFSSTLMISFTNKRERERGILVKCQPSTRASIQCDFEDTERAALAWWSKCGQCSRGHQLALLAAILLHQLCNRYMAARHDYRNPSQLVPCGFCRQDSCWSQMQASWSPNCWECIVSPRTSHVEGEVPKPRQACCASRSNLALPFTFFFNLSKIKIQPQNPQV